MTSRKEPRAPSPRSALTETFVEHGSFLKSFLRRFLHRQQDIEDIAQEAYVRAFTAEQKGEVSHPKALLFTVAKNIALNELRSKARRVTDYVEECQTAPEETGDTIEEEVVALEQLEAYCVAVDQLPEQCRRVYLMRKVHGLAYKEIAERLQITVRTVERHLQKGVLRCRAHILEEEARADKRSGDTQDSVVTLRKGGQ